MNAQAIQASQRLLADVAASLSGRALEEIARIERETKAEVSRVAAIDARNMRKRIEEERRQAQWLTKRMPLAQTGLARLLAIGGSESVQEIIRARKLLKTGSADITFFVASRPSGDAWDSCGERGSGTRDVWVCFCEQYVSFVYGGFASGQSAEWHVLYNPCSPKEAVEKIDVWKNEIFVVGSQIFLNEIASPYPSNMSVIRHESQRSYEWQPEQIVFQLLVSCSRRSRCDNYLVRCLEKLKTNS